MTEMTDREKLVELAKLVKHKHDLQSQAATTVSQLLRYCIAKVNQVHPHSRGHLNYFQMRKEMAKLRDEKKLAWEILRWMCEALERPEAKIYLPMEGCPDPKASGDLTPSTEGE
jgi:hypothetical protein